MSGLDWTTTGLLAQIRSLGRIPDADPDATDASLLLEANRQLEQVFVPMIRRVRGEYYQTRQDQAFVALQDEYRIPPRSAGSTVRTVLWILTSGVEIELPPVPMTDRHLYQPARGVPCAYALEDDRVVIMPKPSSATLGTLRIVYERRPSMLVLPASAAQVTAVTTVSGNYHLTLPNVANLTVSSVGTLLDIVSATPPFSLVMQDSVVAVAVTTTRDLTPANADRVPSVGDWACSQSETVIPQIPAEFHPVLALSTAVEYLRPISPGDASVLEARLDKALEALKPVIQPRNVGRQMKIKSTSSGMRRATRRRGGFSDWRP